MVKKNLYDLDYPWLDAKKTKSVACCICSSEYRQKVLFSFLLNRKRFEIRKCEKDKLMYLFPQLGKKYCRQLYNHPSYFKSADDMYGLYMDNKKAKKIAQIRIKEILKYSRNSGSLLEIGCAYGHLLEEAKRKGFKKIYGIEFSKEAVNICKKKGLKIIYADINNLEKLKIKFSYDIIVLYSVLEHLVNPQKFIQKIKKIIKSNGIFIFRVPETDSQNGPRISLLDHFWHFTRFSIRKILSDNNFKIKGIFPSGKFNGIQHRGSVRSMTVVSVSN